MQPLFLALSIFELPPSAGNPLRAVLPKAVQPAEAPHIVQLWWPFSQVKNGKCCTPDSTNVSGGLDLHLRQKPHKEKFCRCGTAPAKSPNLLKTTGGFSMRALVKIATTVKRRVKAQMQMQSALEALAASQQNLALPAPSAQSRESHALGRVFGGAGEYCHSYCSTGHFEAATPCVHFKGWGA
jgi:hypothetical protein